MCIRDSFVPGNKALPEMPRLGMRMLLPAEYDVMTWLGRGPQENYADRKTGYPIGLYTATVWEQFHPYVRAPVSYTHLFPEPVCLSSVWCCTPFYKNLSGIPHCF